MAQIRHIAISAKDPDKTAEFYKKHFGMWEVERLDDELAEGMYLTDGYINLAILKLRRKNTIFEHDRADFIGIHHFGFHVEDLEETSKALEADGIPLGSIAPTGTPGSDTIYFEKKYLAPDGVIIDVSKRGWVGAGGREGHRGRMKGETGRRTQGTRERWVS